MDLFSTPFDGVGTIKSTKGVATKANKPRIVVEVEFLVDEDVYERIRDNGLSAYFAAGGEMPADFKSLTLTRHPEPCKVAFACGSDKALLVTAQVAPSKITRRAGSGGEADGLVLSVVIDSPGTPELWRMLYDYITHAEIALGIQNEQAELPLDAGEDKTDTLAEIIAGKPAAPETPATVLTDAVPAAKEPEAEPAPPPAKKRGRPKGAKNKPKPEAVAEADATDKEPATKEPNVTVGAQPPALGPDDDDF